MKPERRLPVTPLTLEVVREADHLEEIKAEWTGFATGLERITPFQLPDWQLTWWRHFGEGRLHVMLFRSLDRLVGIVPCYRTEDDHGAAIQLIGSGMASYLEPPIAPSQRRDVANLLNAHLLANKAWKSCDWRDVEPTSPLASVHLGERFEMKMAPDSEWSQLIIQGSFEDYWNGRSFSLRRNFLRYLDTASVAERPRFEVVTQADPEFVNAVIRLQGEQTAAFARAKDGSAAFLADLARVFDNADRLRLFGLRHNRKLVAAMLAFVHLNTLYAFSVGHDIEFEALGFGRLLLFEALRYAFQQGYRAWNFLRGNEPYKLLWGAQMSPTARIIIERKPTGSAQLQ